jgi:integrase
MKIPEPRKLPSGSWFIQLRIDGQSVPITETSADRATAKAMAIKSGLIKAKKKPSDKTLREACTEKIEGLRPLRSPSTIYGYEKIRDDRFQTLMDMKISCVTQKVLREAVSKECDLKVRTGKKITAKTVINAYMFIAPVLRENGCEFETPPLPEIKRKPPKILSAEEVLPVIIGSSIELPCLLAAWLTLSMSEIQGLTKSKSIQNGKLYVIETVIDVKGKAIRKDGGKEEERTRVLDIPSYIQDLIDKVEGDVVVPLSSHAIYMRLKRLLESNNLPHMSFHQLRHLSASVMAMLGVAEKDAQDKGGWKTSYTMKQVYTHTFTQQRLDSDRKVDAYFNGIINNISQGEA